MTQKTTQPTPYETPDFAEFVTDLDHGKINQHLTEQLAKVVAAVEDTGKQGELIIRLLVKKEGKMAVVGVEIKAKAPQHPLHGTLFYIGDNGELLREDPRRTMKDKQDIQAAIEAGEVRARLMKETELPVFAGKAE